MTLDFSPDLWTFSIAVSVAVLLLAGAVALTIRRRSRGERIGAAVHVLLVCATIAVWVAYEAYVPSCPRGWYC